MAVYRIILILKLILILSIDIFLHIMMIFDTYVTCFHVTVTLLCNEINNSIGQYKDWGHNSKFIFDDFYGNLTRDHKLI